MAQVARIFVAVALVRFDIDWFPIAHAFFAPILFLRTGYKPVPHKIGDVLFRLAKSNFAHRPLRAALPCSALVCLPVLVCSAVIDGCGESLGNSGAVEPGLVWVAGRFCRDELGSVSSLGGSSRFRSRLIGFER